MIKIQKSKKLNALFKKLWDHDHFDWSFFWERKEKHKINLPANMPSEISELIRFFNKMDKAKKEHDSHHPQNS